VTISRVLVTGASGQLAGSIVRAFADREVIAHTRATLDVTDGDAVRREAARSRPDLIVLDVLDPLHPVPACVLANVASKAVAKNIMIIFFIVVVRINIPISS